MQSYHSPSMDQNRSHSIWLSMLEDIAGQNLNVSTLPGSFFKLMTLSVFLSLSLSVAWFHKSSIAQVLSCLMAAFFIAQFSFLGHDAGHGSLHKRKVINHVIGQFCMTIVAGLAFEEWYWRHRTHHQFCQFEGRDPDMDVRLVVSLTANSRKTKNALGLWFTRYQNLHVWFLSLLFAHSQRHLSHWGVLQHPIRFSKDLIALVLHFFLWWVLPYFVLNVDGARIALVYVLPLFFLGPYMAAIFWVNHVGMPLIRNPESFAFLEHQAITSRTILNPKCMDWFFGGLNYQIEHHLYPQIPSFRLKKVQPIVQNEFRRQSLVYNGVSFRRAVRDIARHFRQVGRSQL